MRFLDINNQKGFTLLEVLIGLVIFAVGILGVNAMQLASIKGNSKSRTVSEASTVSADRIETMIPMAYNNTALDDADGDGTNQDGNQDGTDDDGGNFGLDDVTSADADGSSDSDGDGVDDIFWNIALDHPIPNTKTIKVHVQPKGDSNMVTFSFIKSDPI